MQLSDHVQGTRSPLRNPKKTGNPNGEGTSPPVGNSDDHDCHYSSDNNCAPGSSESWMELSIAGNKPAPRFNHAAAVIENKMVVVGGESGNGMLDDVQVLNFDQFSWTTASSKIYLSPTNLPLKIPACKGHSLVSWGKKALLVGGKTDPSSEKVSVWSFDTETECWSLMEAKGDIPVARSGHAVVRVGSNLILFGGEDSKRRKLNDLYMFELKSMTWLPLHCTGAGPSPRSNHVAVLYDDRTLFIFGGSSKSKTLNDLYSLDFETMVWNRIKIRGFHPSPRAGSCGVLCGTKWYIVGGGSRKKRHAETLVFDVLKHEWSVAFASPPSSITTSKGFSLVLVQLKEKDYLVVFGGSKKEPSNQVKVLVLEKNEHLSSSRAPTNKVTGKNNLASQLNLAPPHPGDFVGQQNLASIINEHGSSRRSMSERVIGNPNLVPGNISLRKQLSEEELVHTLANSSLDDNPFMQSMEQNKLHDMRSLSNVSGKVITEVIPSSSELDYTDSLFSDNDKLAIDDERIFPIDDKSAIPSSASSTIPQVYEAKLAALIRKNGNLEGQLAAALAGREAAEKNLSCAMKSRQELEKKLCDTVKETELLKEKLAGLELAHEEANSVSNMVHSDNVRLEHDVAFVRAVLDDTQKELHSTRGILANENARAFQLQFEVFHLKRRLQSLENRATTPSEPFQV